MPVRPERQKGPCSPGCRNLECLAATPTDDLESRDLRLKAKALESRVSELERDNEHLRAILERQT